MSYDTTRSHGTSCTHLGDSRSAIRDPRSTCPSTRRAHAAHHTACRVLLEKMFVKLIIFDNAIEVCRCRLQQHHQRRLLVYTNFRLIQNTDVFGRLKWSRPERSGRDRRNTHYYVMHTSRRHALNGAFAASFVWLMRPSCYQMQCQRYSNDMFTPCSPFQCSQR